MLRQVSSLAKTQPHITWFVPMGMAQWLLDNTAVTADQVVCFEISSKYFSKFLMNKVDQFRIISIRHQ